MGQIASKTSLLECESTGDMPHGFLVLCIHVSSSKYRIGKSMTLPKVDISNSLTCLNQTPSFKRYVVRCGSKNGCQRCVFKKDWTMCSKEDNHCRLNSQHNRRVLYDQLVSTRIFTFDNE